MNKEYMILAANKRLEELKKQYYTACMDKTTDGKQLSKNGAAVLRSRLKRDICILTLILELLNTSSSAVYITDQDACLGFDKLMKE